MKKNQGMTLIELMVVICIIGILATVVLNVGRGVVLKSQIQSTQSTILALSNACEQYHALYYCYPLLNSSTAFKPDNKSDHAGRLHYALECWPDSANSDMDIEEDPVLTSNLPKKIDENITTTPDPNKNSLYIDAWSEPLWVCYGRNHSGDTPKGPNNQSTVSSYPNSTPLDIMSAGPDGELQFKDKNNETTYNFNDTDDIVSWMLNINKALRNTRD